MQKRYNCTILEEGLSPDFSVAHDPKKVHNCLVDILWKIVLKLSDPRNLILISEEIPQYYILESPSIMKKVKAITQAKISDCNLK